MLIKDSPSMQESIRMADYIGRAIKLLFLAYPIFLLSVRNGMSTCLVLLALVSFAYFLQAGRLSIAPLRPIDVLISASMASLIVATLLSEIYHHSFDLQAFDSASRFLLAIPIYLMLRTAPLTFLRSFEYGIPLGALAGFLTSIIFPGAPVQRVGTYFLDAPMFGGAMLTLGFLAVSSINWTHSDNPFLHALKIAGFAAGLYCAVESGERGIWIAIPVLGMIWIVYCLPMRWRVPAAAIAIAAAVFGYWLMPTVKERVAATQWEIAQMMEGNFNTSAGQRLQIWNGAIEIVRENPIFGVGPSGTESAIRELGARGWFTDDALKSALAQLHNEILSHAMRLGVFGLFAILAIYFVPIVLFARAMKSGDSIKQIAGLMGALFVTAYLIFGFSVETFNLKMLASYYAVTVVALLAIIQHADTQSLSRNGENRLMS